MTSTRLQFHPEDLDFSDVCTDSTAETLRMARDPRTNRVVQRVISQALEDRASDIHIEPEAEGVRIRFRIFGVLREAVRLPRALRPLVTARLKMMAGLDAGERGLPQDGRMSMSHQGRPFDFRISIMPTIHGEKVVVRIVDKQALQFGFSKLGFYPDTLSRWEALLARPEGMLLVTGPTGSGRSTTLYACLKHLNTPERNLSTVEDPVKAEIPGVNQLQVRHDLNFVFGLGAALRQDSETVMLGNLPDRRTAEVALEAALTGRRILAGFYAPDACGALSRLLDMGVEPYRVASGIKGILAQRLVRCCCPACREGIAQYYRGRGCERCEGTGYLGRTGVHEVLEMTEDLRQAVLNRAAPSDLRQAALKAGMLTMQNDTLRKLLDGVTSEEECAASLRFGCRG